MDSVVINITDMPNDVTANIIETPINVIINVSNLQGPPGPPGLNGLLCADLVTCQTIIDIS